MTNQKQTDECLMAFERACDEAIERSSLSDMNCRFHDAGALRGFIFPIWQAAIEWSRTQPAVQPDYEKAMENAAKILANFQGAEAHTDGTPARKLEEWEACYAHLFTQMQPLMAELRKLQAPPDHDKLRQVREALDYCRWAVEPYDDIKPRNWVTDREHLKEAHQKSKQALAILDTMLEPIMGETPLIANGVEISASQVPLAPSPATTQPE